MKEPRRDPAERVISLPNMNQPSFQMYHQWLLTGNFYSKSHPSELARLTKEHAAGKDLIELYAAFELGHDLEGTAFIDTITDAILQWAADHFNIESWVSILLGGKTHETHERISMKSPVRKLMAHLVTSRKIREEDMLPLRDARGSDTEEANVNFLFDLVQAIPTSWDAPCSWLTTLND